MTPIRPGLTASDRNYPDDRPTNDARSQPRPRKMWGKCGTAVAHPRTTLNTQSCDQHFCGGGERIRTADFYVANVALCQLSYTPEGSRPLIGESRWPEPPRSVTKPRGNRRGSAELQPP